MGLRESNFVKMHMVDEEPVLLSPTDIQEYLRGNTRLWYLGSNNAYDYFNVQVDKYGKYAATFKMKELRNLPFERITYARSSNALDHSFTAKQLVAGTGP